MPQNPPQEFRRQIDESLALATENRALAEAVGAHEIARLAKLLQATAMYLADLHVLQLGFSAYGFSWGERYNCRMAGLAAYEFFKDIPKAYDASFREYVTTLAAGPTLLDEFDGVMRDFRNLKMRYEAIANSDLRNSVAAHRHKDPGEQLSRIGSIEPRKYLEMVNDLVGWFEGLHLVQNKILQGVLDAYPTK